MIEPSTTTCCDVGDSLQGVVDRQYLLGWMFHSMRHGGLKHNSMSFRTSWNDLLVTAIHLDWSYCCPDLAWQLPPHGIDVDYSGGNDDFFT